MVKAIIIEDEIYAREGLKKMINLLEPSIKIIGETGFVHEAIDLIEKKKPTLVFIDVELEDGSGFEILNRLKKINFKIIFTTAYNQYAINAFKFSAIDYLLKPIDPTELSGAIHRAIRCMDCEERHKDLLTVLKNNINNNEPKIVLKTTEQLLVIYLKDIIRLEADGNYTTFITTDQKTIISKSIKYYQNMLDKTFIRCHQSHLVNSKHVINIDKNSNFQMSNNDLVPISNRKKSEIFKIFN